MITYHDRDHIKSTSSLPILKYQSRNNQAMYALIMSDTDGRCSARQYPSSCSQCIPSPHHQIILRLAYHYCRLLIEIRVNTFTELSSRTIFLALKQHKMSTAWLVVQLSLNNDSNSLYGRRYQPRAIETVKTVC